MITIDEYTPERKNGWNEFVRLSRNGHFMFDRDYMDYHADRFIDHSLLCMDGNKVIGVFPANRVEERRTIVSHGGLTFGGLVISNKTTQVQVIACFDAILSYCSKMGIRKLIYKPIPYIYSENPAQDDLYCAFMNDATLVRRDVSSAIYLPNRIRYRKTKKGTIKKSTSMGTEVSTCTAEQFWPLLADVLQNQHGVRPVHTLEEIQLLQSRFPDNILCLGARLGSEWIAGAVLFLNRGVAHTQYLAASDVARKNGALDLVIDTAIRQYECAGYRYFNFGISTERDGRELNEGLLFQKEGFGARTVCHDFYEFNL